MFRALVNFLPSEVFILFLMFLIGGTVHLIFILTQRYIPKLFDPEAEKFLVALIGIASANYAFILGFVIISLWNSLHEAQLDATREAAKLASMSQYGLGLPEPYQTNILKAIGQYVNSITLEEWPLMREGKSSLQTQQSLNHLFHVIETYAPETTNEQSIYSQLLNHLSGVVEQRNLRLVKLNSSLIVPLRFILIWGILSIGFFFSLYEHKKRTLHLLIILAVTAILSFNVGLAFSLDYPYSGDFSVNSRPFKEGILARFYHPSKS